MKYKLTALNIFMAGYMLYAIYDLVYFFLYEGGWQGDPWDGLAVMLRIPLILFWLLIDYVLQRAIKNPTYLHAVSIIIVVIFLLWQ